MSFSIRDLFLVTALVALMLGWCLHAATMRAELDPVYKARQRNARMPNSSAPAPNPPKP